MKCLVIKNMIMKSLNLKKYPTTINDVPKFENLKNLKINVFRLIDNKITTIYNTKERNENVVNLLLIYGNNGNNHYVWIKDLAKLIDV